MAPGLTGEQVDGATGLQYLRARYYDPAIGRFLSQDPLPGGHPYAYVGSNPVRYVDPSGLTEYEVLDNPFDCSPFSLLCGGGGGRGGRGGRGGGVSVPIGPAIGAGVAAGAAGATWAGGQAIGGVEDAWGGVTSVFSGGKSERGHLKTIRTSSEKLYHDVCKLPTLPYCTSSVETDVRKHIKNILDAYRHLKGKGVWQQRAVETFKEQFWDKPCKPKE